MIISYYIIPVPAGIPGTQKIFSIDNPSGPIMELDTQRAREEHLQARHISQE
jgi:hypothetical protein